jgi:hypothetical protein
LNGGVWEPTLIDPGRLHESVGANGMHAFVQASIACNNGATLAGCDQLFLVEAEAPHHAVPAYGTATIARPMRLRGILDNRDAVPLTDFQ